MRVSVHEETCVCVCARARLPFPPFPRPHHHTFIFSRFSYKKQKKKKKSNGFYLPKVFFFYISSRLFLMSVFLIEAAPVHIIGLDDKTVKITKAIYLTPCCRVDCIWVLSVKVLDAFSVFCFVFFSDRFGQLLLDLLLLLIL